MLYHMERAQHIVFGMKVIFISCPIPCNFSQLRLRVIYIKRFANTEIIEPDRNLVSYFFRCNSRTIISSCCNSFFCHWECTVRMPYIFITDKYRHVIILVYRRSIFKNNRTDNVVMFIDHCHGSMPDLYTFENSPIRIKVKTVRNFPVDRIFVIYIFRNYFGKGCPMPGITTSIVLCRRITLICTLFYIFNNTILQPLRCDFWSNPLVY